MRRSTVLGAAVTLAALVLPSPASAAGGEAACTKPVPVRQYGPDGMSYGFDLDLSGCDWWDGGEIEMSATLRRSDGLSDEMTEVFVLCGMETARPAGDDAPTGDDPRYEAAGTSTCSVLNEIGHPIVEVAHYQGEIWYPWEDGLAIVGFAAVCTSNPATPTCVDVPAFLWPSVR